MTEHEKKSPYIIPKKEDYKKIVGSIKTKEQCPSYICPNPKCVSHEDEEWGRRAIKAENEGFIGEEESMESLSNRATNLDLRPSFKDGKEKDLLRRKLNMAKTHLGFIDNVLKDNPELSAMAELLAVCKQIDQQYKEQCELHDDHFDDSYNDGGLSTEFYVESELWHELSLAFRKLEGG